MEIELIKLAQNDYECCPRCGKDECIEWAVKGFNGYIDACRECAPTVAAEEIEIGAMTLINRF